MQNPIKQYALNIEAFALEVILGVISAILAVGGFNAHVIHIAIPSAIVSLVCWGLVIHSISLVIHSRRKIKKQRKTKLK